MGHRSFEDYREEIRALEAVIEVGALYAHYKNNDVYVALGYVVLEATDELAVRYSDSKQPDIEFIRPASSWLDVIDGIPRFSQIERT